MVENWLPFKITGSFTSYIKKQRPKTIIMNIETTFVFSNISTDLKYRIIVNFQV